MKIVFRAAAGLAMTAALTLGAEFSGSVVDAATGKPISGAIVTLGAKDARTDANGGFRISGDGPLVQARAYGYDRTHLTADTHNARSLRLTLHAITPHAVYLSFWGVSSSAVREPVLNLAKTSPVNAVVIDVKGDMGYVSFKTGLPLANEIGAEKMTTISDIHALLDRLHSQGFYAIGRIVTFKDNMLCRAHTEWAVQQNGKAFKDKEGLAWCDPFHQEVRSYNIGLAIEAAKAGFDEIEFDYVRFPDAKGVEFSHESTEESRPKAIDGFLREARQKLLPYNVFLAADVFGYICWNQGDTGIGQKIGDVADVLDYISPMLYPSGFSFGIPNYRNPVQHPYEIVRLSLDRAAERTKIDPKRFRPWLQAFADYAFDKRQFGPKELQAQIKAAEDFGSDGWLLWNPRNVYSAEAIRSVRRSETVAAARSTVKAGAGAGQE